MKRNFNVNGLLRGALLCSALSLMVAGFWGCGDDSSSGADPEYEKITRDDKDSQTSKPIKVKIKGLSSSSASEYYLGKSSATKASKPDTSFWGPGVSRDDFLNPNISYGEMTDSRDGQVYKTVQIDTMVWMAQNLNFDFEKYGYGTSYASHCYDDNEKNCEVGGRLYPWIIVYKPKFHEPSDSSKNLGRFAKKNMDQGLCPDGWHIPGSDEWDALLQLAEKGGLPFTSTKDGGTDDFGFSAILNGQMLVVEDTLMSRYAGTGAMFWMYTKNFDERASSCYYLSIDPYDGTYMISMSKWCANDSYGSLRCVKNYPSTLDLLDMEDYKLYGSRLDDCEEVWFTEDDYKTCTEDLSRYYIYDKMERMPKMCEYDKDSESWVWFDYD